MTLQDKLILTFNWYFANYLLLFIYFIDYEIARQIGILEAGGEVVNETRAYNIDNRYTLNNAFSKLIIINNNNSTNSTEG